MSDRDIELLRGWIEAFNARDIDALVARCTPDIEFHSAFAAMGGVYRGRDEMRRWHRDLEDAWGSEIYLEPVAFFDLGELILSHYVYHGRGQQSGADVAMPASSVTKWRDGLMAYVKVYLDPNDALRQLGVSGNELIRIAP
jgi:ketosteroid isomerase-like protein